MLSEEKQKQILQKIKNEWNKRQADQLEGIRQMLTLFPHDDGCQRVSVIEGGSTHLVPIEDIILYGLKGEDVEKYPVEENNPNKDDLERNPSLSEHLK